MTTQKRKRQVAKRTHQDYIREKCETVAEYVERDLEADAVPCILLRKAVALPFRLVSWVLT